MTTIKTWQEQYNPTVFKNKGRALRWKLMQSEIDELRTEVNLLAGYRDRALELAIACNNSQERVEQISAHRDHAVSIHDAPKGFSFHEKAFWVFGYNEAVKAHEAEIATLVKSGKPLEQLIMEENARWLEEQE